jgi:hypothetical protein
VHAEVVDDLLLGAVVIEVRASDAERILGIGNAA